MQSNEDHITNGFCPVDTVIYNDDASLYIANESGVLITRPGTYIVQASFHILFASGDAIQAKVANTRTELVTTTYLDKNNNNSKQSMFSITKIVKIPSGQDRVLLYLESTTGNSFFYNKNESSINRIAVSKIN